MLDVKLVSAEIGVLPIGKILDYFFDGRVVESNQAFPHCFGIEEANKVCEIVSRRDGAHDCERIRALIRREFTRRLFGADIC